MKATSASEPQREEAAGARAWSRPGSISLVLMLRQLPGLLMEEQPAELQAAAWSSSLLTLTEAVCIALTVGEQTQPEALKHAYSHMLAR